MQWWGEVQKIDTGGLMCVAVYFLEHNSYGADVSCSGRASVSPDGAHVTVSNLMSGFDIYALEGSKLVSLFH